MKNETVKSYLNRVTRLKEELDEADGDKRGWKGMGMEGDGDGKCSIKM